MCKNHIYFQFTFAKSLFKYLGFHEDFCQGIKNDAKIKAICNLFFLKRHFYKSRIFEYIKKFHIFIIPFLSNFSLHGTHLGDHGVEVMLPALRSHPNLQSLDLGDCHIGDEGIKHICTLLEPVDDKDGIQDLTLSANHSITAYGWTHLAMAIAANSQIKGLYLDYNHIGDYGAGIFSVAMAANRNLERLDLEGTGITDKGAKLLASSIKTHCKKLQELVLAENPISEDLVESITDSLMIKASESIENGHDTSKSSENGSPKVAKQSPRNGETESIAETQ